MKWCEPSNTALLQGHLAALVAWITHSLHLANPKRSFSVLLLLTSWPYLTEQTPSPSPDLGSQTRPCSPPFHLSVRQRLPCSAPCCCKAGLQPSSAHSSAAVRRPHLCSEPSAQPGAFPRT